MYLKAHELSKCHQESVLKIFTLPSTTKDIGEALSRQHEQGMLENRHCFLKVLSNIRFLARQGLPLRGDGNEAPGFYLAVCWGIQNVTVLHSYNERGTD